MTVPPKMKMHIGVFEEIMSFFSQGDCERGCLIGASRFLNYIDAFASVPGASGKDYFIPDMDAVNRQIAQWTEEGICFCGFFHSHPNGAIFLSHEDHIAIESWVLAANLPFLCFGVADGMGGLKLYLAYKEESGSVSVCEMKQSTNFGEVEYIQWRSEYEYFFCS